MEGKPETVTKGFPGGSGLVVRVSKGHSDVYVYGEGQPYAFALGPRIGG